MPDTHKKSSPSAAQALSRRQALLAALTGSAALTLWPKVNSTASPDPAETAKESSMVVETRFVPENDYPFFGFEP